jgi:hypothetical protein
MQNKTKQEQPNFSTKEFKTCRSFVPDRFFLCLGEYLLHELLLIRQFLPAHNTSQLFLLIFYTHRSILNVSSPHLCKLSSYRYIAEHCTENIHISIHITVIRAPVSKIVLQNSGGPKKRKLDNTLRYSPIVQTIDVFVIDCFVDKINKDHTLSHPKMIEQNNNEMFEILAVNCPIQNHLLKGSVKRFFVFILNISSLPKAIPKLFSCCFLR